MEKKEIGKLIELLNEFEKTLEPNLQIEWTEVGIKSTPEIVISKKYGFIKWLVENEKTHREKIPAIIKVDGYLADGSDTEYYNMEESLLMLLSISSSPIDDLLSYLK